MLIRMILILINTRFTACVFDICEDMFICITITGADKNDAIKLKIP